MKVVERIVWAWIMTIPATMAVSFGLVWAVELVGGGK